MSQYYRIHSSLLRSVFLFSWFCYGSFATTLTCPRSNVARLIDAQRFPQCPDWFERSFPDEINGDTLEKELNWPRDGAYHSVFFYASWCPFSKRYRSTFDALSSMFPQIRHLAVERHSALPSVFSRYGIHSFPTFMLANRTARIRYHGPKDLDSLILFYKEVTDENPTAYIFMDQAEENAGIFHPWKATFHDFLNNEPYLAFSLLFVVLKALTFFFPKFITQLKAFWTLYFRLLVDLTVFSGLNQLLGRAVHLIDIKKIWTKLGLSSKRSFWRGAKSARVWASSLASSVSINESSSSS